MSIRRRRRGGRTLPSEMIHRNDDDVKKEKKNLGTSTQIEVGVVGNVGMDMRCIFGSGSNTPTVQIGPMERKKALREPY